MGFRTLLFTYLLGGLTFIPLLVLSAWYLLPRTIDVDEKDVGDEDTKSGDGTDRISLEKQRQGSTADEGAVLVCAVLRRYDLQAALTALSTKPPGSTNGNGDNSPDGAAADSVSVYQSMYRSVFTGNKPNSSTSSLLQREDTESPGIRRKPAPANVLYIVLRHGHLMVYDSPAQVEVKHVISLANHSVSLQAGTIDDDDMDERLIPESDLFIKRTAIVLTPVELPGGALQQPTTSPKPFYLFSATNIEKEAFYHALLAARSYPPVPRPLDVDALIKLQSTLHSSSMTPEARALNAIIGRMFLALHRTDALNDFVRSKIEKKLARIQKPTFIPSLRIQSLNLGDAGPIFSNLKMRDLNISGDMTISAEMKYTGGLSITFLAVARLDLGPRFKARTVDLVLKTTIKRVSGNMLFHIKPPPSNRSWFCFESVPEMEIRVEPVVSERKITYGFVLRAIEERIRIAIAEGLVKPNWDDIPMPFTDTRGSHARGGLWRHEGEPDNLQAVKSRATTDRAEKTVSVPEFPSGVDVAASTGLAKSATMPVDDPQIRRRTMDSPMQGTGQDTSPERPQQSTLPPKPLRSPSMSSMTPSVAIDGQNVEPVRSDDASLRSTSTTNRRLWRPGGQPNSQSQPRDALEELRDLRDRAEKTISTMRDGHISEFHDGEVDTPSTPADTEASSSTYSRRPSDGSISSPIAARAFSVQSADSERSTVSSLSSTQSGQSQSKKANVLAATVAATNAARNWGWNTLQRNKSVFPRVGAKPEPGTPITDQPMGRGQPLPPPGVPLPGPQQKTLWSNMKRKPVPNLPPRRPTEDRIKDDHLPRESEEFEAWQENSGPVESQDFAITAEDRSESNLSRSQSASTDRENDLKVPVETPNLSRKSSWEASKIPVRAGRTPPPLPRRPSPVHERSTRSTASSASTRTETGGSLHVPEDAVDAVAAENATPNMAGGATDNPSFVNESEGVEAVLPDSRRLSRSPSSHSALSETTDKFVRGEDVKEEDFERDGSGLQAESRNTEPAQSEEDLLAERVRARIQHHKLADGSPASSMQGSSN